MRAHTKLEKIINYMLQADQAMRLGQSDEDAIKAADRLHYAISRAILSGPYHRLPAKSLYALAMILHHSGTASELHTAQHLAQKAAAQRHPNARWLSAAIYDRRRIMKGKPQKYGTQFTMNKGSGKFELKSIDDSCSDMERAAMGLPTLSEIRISLERMTVPH